MFVTWCRYDGQGIKIAQRHGLLEADGGLETKDKRNANIAASCIAFLTTQPHTGKSTMQTVNLFVNNR